MREIKFRAWDMLLGKYVNPRFANIDKGRLYCPDYSDDDIVLQQFTGLRDKNGKEIYEGDIVKDMYGQINEITYSCGSYWFNWLSIPQCSEQVEKGEVIGNVYEKQEAP